jgi:hypothetical protein
MVHRASPTAAISCALLLIAVSSLFNPCTAFADTIFNVVNYNSDQNGWTLSGTIDVLTVGGNSTIQSEDIILSNGLSSYALTGIDGNAAVSVQGNDLLVSPGDGFNFTSGPYPSVAIQYFNEAGRAGYIGGVANGPNLGWSQFFWDVYPTPYNDAGARASVPGDYIGTAPMIIGTAASATPEPTTFTMVGLGIAALAVMRRRTRQLSVATPPTA